MTEGDPSQKKDDTPLYRRIKAELKRRIADGAWKPGAALPNRNLLSSEFNTTRVTVDKAIQQLIDEGVLTSQKGSGTFVAPQRSGGRKVKPKRHALHIAVVFGPDAPRVDKDTPQSEVDHIFYGPVSRGISEGLAGKPVEISYARLTGREYLKYVREADVDGLILITPTVADLPALHDLLDESTTFVAISVSSATAENAILPCIDAANRDGGASAAQHLLGLGHRRIACINLAMGYANHEDRMGGFLDALERAGTTIDPELLLVHGDKAYELTNFEGYIDEWLQRTRLLGKLPTAIFTCDFAMTMATLTVLRRNCIDVPSSVSLMGFDDPLMMSHLTPPITTIRQPVYSLGLRAAQRLLEALYSPGGPRRVVGTELLRTQVMVRESTATPRETD